MKALVPILPVSDLRHKPKEVFARLGENPIVLTLRGRPRAVLVDYDAYNRIVERQQALEETLDVLLLQRAQESATGYQPFEALLRQHEELFCETIELPQMGESDIYHSSRRPPPETPL